MTRGWRAHRGAIAGTIATAALVAPLGWMWWSSLVPDTYSVMDMGVVDLGGGASHGGHGDHATTDNATLTGPRTQHPDVSVTLVARQETVELEDGPAVDGYTLNGSSPGPTLRASSSPRSHSPTSCRSSASRRTRTP